LSCFPLHDCTINRQLVPIALLDALIDGITPESFDGYF
jgi:hypothetical protein